MTDPPQKIPGGSDVGAASAASPGSEPAGKPEAPAVQSTSNPPPSQAVPQQTAAAPSMSLEERKRDALAFALGSGGRGGGGGGADARKRKGGGLLRAGKRGRVMGVARRPQFLPPTGPRVDPQGDFGGPPTLSSRTPAPGHGGEGAGPSCPAAAIAAPGVRGKRLDEGRVVELGIRASVCPQPPSAAGLPPAPAQPPPQFVRSAERRRPRGRPRIHPPAPPSAPRPRGRPRKTTLPPEKIAEVQAEVAAGLQDRNRTVRAPYPYHPIPLGDRLALATASVGVGVCGDESSALFDEEYARFMRSILADDAVSVGRASIGRASIGTFGRSVGRNSVGVGGGIAYNSPAKSVTGMTIGDHSAVGSAFETLDEDDASYQLTSEEEDDDDDDEEDETDETPADGTEPQKGGPGSPEKEANVGPMGDLDLGPYDSNFMYKDDDAILESVFCEIEGLMEEDLEAALVGMAGGGGEHQDESSGGGTSSKPAPYTTPVPVPVAAAVETADSSSEITPIPPGKAGRKGGRPEAPGVVADKSTRRKKATTTVVAAPGILPPSAIPAANGATAAGRRPQAAQHGRPKSAKDLPPVTSDQMTRLRRLVAAHQQLLLQQATLSVRAAYVQKVRKDGAAPSSASRGPRVVGPAAAPEGAADPVSGGRGGATLPSGGLDARSLTFCAPAAHPRVTYQNDFHCNETAEELSGLLDGAVGMLQDLEGNWKDAVRNSIQLGGNTSSGARAKARGEAGRASVCRGLESDLDGAANECNGGDAEAADGNGGQENRRLTRSAFTRTLLEREEEGTSREGGHDATNAVPSSSPVRAGTRGAADRRVSVFAVRGLSRLRDTFAALDDSVRNLGRTDRAEDGGGGGAVDIIGPDEVRQVRVSSLPGLGSPPEPALLCIFPFCFCSRSDGQCACTLSLVSTVSCFPTGTFAIPQHGKACENLLTLSGSDVDPACIPGRAGSDAGELLTHAPEAFPGPTAQAAPAGTTGRVGRPLTPAQVTALRRNRNLFTAGEDNLILRGVNLYGEKEWALVSDRFLPDRCVFSGSRGPGFRLCFCLIKSLSFESTIPRLISQQKKGRDDHQPALRQALLPHLQGQRGRDRRAGQGLRRAVREARRPRLRDPPREADRRHTAGAGPDGHERAPVDARGGRGDPPRGPGGGRQPLGGHRDEPPPPQGQGAHPEEVPGPAAEGAEGARADGRGVPEAVAAGARAADAGRWEDQRGDGRGGHPGGPARPAEEEEEGNPQGEEVAKEGGGGDED